MSDILTQLRKAELECEKTMKPLGSVFKAAADEIERLRSALSKIVDTDPDEGTAWFHDVANDALKEDNS